MIALERGVVTRTKSVFRLAVLVAISWVSTVLAAPMAPDRLPASLKPWVSWVLHGHEAMACPPLFNAPDVRTCAWPGELAIDLTDHGGAFRQRVDVFAPDTVISLPGDQEVWPQDVRVDGKALPVLAVHGRPALRLPSGRFQITGSLRWKMQPQSVTVPVSAGILKATLNGVAMTSPPDAEGRIWLQRAVEPQRLDSLSVRTFRHFLDGVPVRSTVRFELTVAGKPREIRLPAAVLENWQIASIDSPLPTRIERDGAATVQVRAGTWSITVGAKFMNPIFEFALPTGAANEEIWAVQTRNEIRVVTAQGLPVLDPKNVGSPPEWAAFPTFLASPGSSLKLIESRRGNAAGDADRVSLTRTFWLDFGGDGYTVQDKLSGNLGHTWRLELHPALALGRVAINGHDQPITTADKTGSRGVELRRANLDMDADSRIENSSRTVLASGWKADISGWNGVLNLPPGWKLLHVSGVDSAPGTWLGRWTLWDIFFVAVIAAGTLRLFGIPMALVFLIGFVLCWHDPQVQLFPWIGVVIASAITRGLPAGRLQQWADRSKMIFAVLALMFLIPFAVTQVRQAFYPALGFQNQVFNPESSVARPASPVGGEVYELDAVGQSAERLESYFASEPRRKAAVEKSYSRAYDKIDPNARNLTGPGIPNWTWQSFRMTIQGPIGMDQTVSFVVLPPWASSLWGVLAVIALALALWRASGYSPAKMSEGLKGVVGKALLLVVIGGGVLGHSGESLASSEPQNSVAVETDSPVAVSSSLLTELRERLTAPPVCMPACAELARILIVANGDRVALHAQYHAQASVAVPLPGQGAHVRPSAVSVGNGNVPLRRDEAGTLWAILPPGVTDITIDIAANRLSEIPITLPMVPHQVASDLTGWSLTGLDARGIATGSMQLTRLVPTQETKEDHGARNDSLPPFFTIERTFSFGQTWTVTTRIRRDGQGNVPATVRVLLLAGESVTDPSIKVDDIGGARREALVEIGERREMTFTSSLDQTASVIVKAAAHARQTEVWMLDASPQWRVSMNGIPPIHQKRGDNWLPTWQPWPGEEIRLSVDKPVAIDGSIMTIDAVSLRATVGKRSSDVSAEIHLRAGTGGNPTITLPNEAQLLSVFIDGQLQPLRSEGRKLTLPVTPGAHNLKLEWRDANGVSAVYASPQIDLGLPAVNATVEIAVPADRVVLMTRGPVMGPAVLLWGLLIVVMILAVIAGRHVDTPLKTIDWLLLGIGLMQWSIPATALVAGWFMVMLVRKRNAPIEDATTFNVVQCVLLLITFMAAVALFSVLKNGLLGYPDMLIQGNGSSAFHLRWYQDRIGTLTPETTMISIPVVAYRIFMLAWALWLAFSVLKWVRWGWTCYSSGTYWKQTKPLFARKQRQAAVVEPENPS